MTDKEALDQLCAWVSNWDARYEQNMRIGILTAEEYQDKLHNLWIMGDFVLKENINWK